MSTQTELPLVLKGLGRAEDALRAADCPGVKAVICSNHGGRNLDGGPASADVLLQVMRHIDPVLHFRIPKQSSARTGSGQALSYIRSIGQKRGCFLLQVTDALRQADRLDLPGHPAPGGDGIEVYVDGGIRRGKDILRALALGATACFCGRPHQWGLSVGGQSGAERVVEILREELLGCMQVRGAKATTVSTFRSSELKL